MRLTKEEKMCVYWLAQEAIQNLEDIRDHEDLDEEKQKQLKKLQSVAGKISKDIYK
ncbi:hypothetical protein [Priestia megaterium]|uniref:hypothetical protein n=1 Tax=Priestia megaterium TaxID=1404 RepID=UPI0015D49DCB|nr:hypothetical protein [Priestia megaterium]